MDEIKEGLKKCTIYFLDESTRTKITTSHSPTVQQDDRQEDKDSELWKSSYKVHDMYEGFIEDVTCNSMEFIGLPSIPNPEVDLEEIIGVTKGVRVGIIDSSHNSAPSNNEFESFNSPPISRPVHGCDAPTKLSGHGFLCASILAGKPQKASFYGLRDGIITGVVPGAQLFLYPLGCIDCGKDNNMIRTAIELAIKDRVKVISMSQGIAGISFEDFEDKWHFDTDIIAQTTLEAYKNKVLVCVPAGNDGPASESLIYGMPWCVNVGACTIGKNLVTSVVVGTKNKVPEDVTVLGEVDHKHQTIKILDRLEGISMNIHEETRFLPLSVDNELPKDEEGILCGTANKFTLKPSVRNQRKTFYMLNLCKWPMTCLSTDNCKKIMRWLSKVGELYVSISSSRYDNDKRGTYVPEFSARGPSSRFPEIIMPDFVAPGCNILGSYSKNISIGTTMRREGNEYKEVQLFNSQRMMTGTSLATPHVAGLFVALLCNRPNWSLAMAKSAAITTAWSFVANGISGDEFTFGAGLMQLKSALNPGLVYDETFENFESYAKGTLGVDRLNMPSFAASFTQSHEGCERSFHRVLTNIEGREVTYEGHIKFYNKSLDADISIEVKPRILKFQPRAKRSFIMNVHLCPVPLGHISALLIWKETKTNNCVVSPIHLYHKSKFDRRLWYYEKKEQKKEY